MGFNRINIVTAQITNPFAPGFGSPPPRLADREAALEDLAVSTTGASQAGGVAILVSGLHGVGKTSLLRAAANRSGADGALAIQASARSDGSLLSSLAVPIRSRLVRFGQMIHAKAEVARALGVLATICAARNRRADGARPGAEIRAVERDTAILLFAVAAVAEAANAPAVLYLDDAQNLSEAELAMLFGAVANSRGAGSNLSVVAAGSPQAERLFMSVPFDQGPSHVVKLGALSVTGAVEALRGPASASGAKFTEQALAEMVARSGCHPFFLQQWANCVWELASDPVIDRSVVARAGPDVEAELDERFFGPLVQHVTPSEWRYLRAMAELGEENCTSAKTADLMEEPMSRLAPVRASLITKGVIFSPARGTALFSAPVLGKYVMRSNPPV